MAPSPALRILVVEDEMTIALLVEDMLLDLGHEVVAVAMRLPQALAQARSAAIDLAVLDVNLDGRPSFPVAAALAERGVPFLFATGYGGAGVDPAFADRTVIKKPFLIGELRAAIAAAYRAGP